MSVFLVHLVVLKRNMRDKLPGNLSESVFTEPGMLDAKENLQQLVEYHRKVRNLDAILFNASDGILIGMLFKANSRF